jgi:nucleoside-diphosphate-sugar epimerase
VTVLLTGGAGLVGTHVLDALRARGERPRALVRERSRGAVEAFDAETVVGDVTDEAAWRRATTGGDVGAIIHSAALVASHEPFDEFLRVNVGGTRLAVETARRTGARLIYVSTVAVYGRTAVYEAGSQGVTEDHPFQPLPDRDFYARSKRTAEEMVRREAERGDVSVIAIRPNVIYGERDQLFTRRLIANLRRRVLPLIGPGTNHLSCVYAGNVASAILAALDAPPKPGFRAYNVTRDAAPLLTQREFFQACAQSLGVRPLQIRVPPPVIRIGVRVWSMLMRVLLPGRYTALGNAAMSFILGENPYSINRIRKELGWSPSIDTRTAIARSVTRHAG